MEDVIGTTDLFLTKLAKTSHLWQVPEGELNKTTSDLTKSEKVD